MNASQTGGRGSKKDESVPKKPRNDEPTTDKKDDDDEMGGKAKGKGRRTRRAGNKHIGTKGDGLKLMLNQLIRLSLHTAQQVRQVKATLVDVFIIAADHEVTKAAEREQRAWLQALEDWQSRRRDAAARGDSGGEPPSSPSATIIMGTLESLAKADVGAKNRTALDVLIMRLSGGPPDSDMPVEVWIHQQVPMMRIEKVRDETQRKITIAAPGYTPTERMMLCLCMVQIGASRRVGPAPAGWLERELSEWLQATA